jgi:putative ABC transport system ATP-binding protein
LLPRANLEDNVALPLIYRGISRAERIRQANMMLEKVGWPVSPVTSQPDFRRPATTGRHRQQLVNQPKLLLADEPTR